MMLSARRQCRHPLSSRISGIALPVLLLIFCCLFAKLAESTDCAGSGGALFYDNPQLQGCTNATSALYVTRTTGINLQKLASLQTVMGQLIIEDNSELKSLRGLDSLRWLGRELRIARNPNLTSMASLGNLSSAKWEIRIENNDRLKSLNGLQGFRSMPVLYILNNANLTSLYGLKNVSSIPYLEINGNPELTSVLGLQQVGVLEMLYIYNNSKLSDLTGLNRVNSLPMLKLKRNPSLTSLAGLLNIVSFQTLIIDNCPLTNLDGLRNLRTVSDRLELTYNSNLTSVQGLSNLTSVKSLRIEDNGKLRSLEGLSGLTQIDAIQIRSFLSFQLEDMCALCGATITGGNTSDALPDFRKPVYYGASFRGPTAVSDWMAAGKPCAVGPVFCNQTLLPTPSQGASQAPAPSSQPPSSGPQPTTLMVSGSEPPTPSVGARSPTACPGSGGSSSSQTPVSPSPQSRPPVASPSAVPQSSSQVSLRSASAAPQSSSQASLTPNPILCTSNPPFPGDMAQCSGGEWVFEPQDGVVEVVENSTIDAPVRINGDLEINEPAWIIFRRTNGRLGGRNDIGPGPLVIIEGDLKLGGSVSVYIDQASNGDFIPLYQVSGTIDGSVVDVSLNVDQPEDCTQYEGKIETRTDGTVGILVESNRQKRCDAATSSANSCQAGLLALAAVLVLCVARFGA